MGILDDLAAGTPPGLGILDQLAYGAPMTLEERLRRTRERLGPNALYGLNDEEEEEQGLLGAAWDRSKAAVKAGYLGVADIASKSRMSPLLEMGKLATGGEFGGTISEAAAKAERERQNEMDRYAGAATRAGLSPVASALTDTALEVLDPLDLVGGVAGAAVPAARLLRRGKAATGLLDELAEGGAKAARESGKFDDLLQGTMGIAGSRDLPAATKKAARVSIDEIDGPTFRLSTYSEDGELIGSGTFTKEPGGGFRVHDVEAHQEIGGVQTPVRGTGGMRLMYRKAQEISGGPRLGSLAMSPEGEAAVGRLAETDPDLITNFSPEELPIGGAGKFRPPETPFQYSANRLDMPGTPEALANIKRVMEDPETLARRRTGVRFDPNDPERLAIELKMTEDDFLGLRPGSVLNTEEAILLDSYVGKWGRKAEELRPVIRSGTATPAQEAAFSQAWVRHNDLLVTSMATSTEAGRVLNSYKQLRKAIDSPEALRTHFAVKFQKLLKQGKLTEADLDLLAKADLDNPDELMAIMAKAQKATTWEKLKDVFFTGILSGIGTFGRNAVNTSFHLAAQVPIRTAEGMIDAPLSKLTGKPREKYVREVLPFIWGTGEGFKDGLVRAAAVWKRDLGGDAGKFAQSRGSAFRRAGTRFEREVVAPALEVPSNVLLSTDQLIKGTARGMEARAYAMRKGLQKGLQGDDLTSFMSDLLENPPKEMIEHLVKFEDMVAFTAELGPKLKAINRVIHDTPLVFAMPFMRIATNLFKEGYRFTPFNALNLAARAGKRAVKGKPVMEGLGAADELARISLGAGIMGYFTYKAARGEVVGHMDPGESQRDTAYGVGKEPFSIRFGDHWYPFSQMEPVAMPAAMVASFMDGWKKSAPDAKLQEKLNTAFGLLLTNRLDMSYMAGLADLVEMMTLNQEGRKSRFLGRQAAATVIPFSGAMRNVANLVDPRLREKQGFADEFLDVIPGLSKRLPARLNRFGEDIRKTRWEAIGPTGTPVVPSPVTDDEVELALDELGLAVNFPGKSIEGEPLDRSEYRAYLQRVGPNTKKLLRNVLYDDAFRAMPQFAQQGVVDKVVQTVQDQGKTEALLGQIPGVPPLAVKKMLAEGMDMFNRRVQISQKYLERTASPGAASASDLLAAKGEAQEEWAVIYSDLQRLAQDARRMNLTDQQIITVLKRKGASGRVARAIVSGREMTYDQYRRRAGGLF